MTFSVAAVSAAVSGTVEVSGTPESAVSGTFEVSGAPGSSGLDLSWS